MSASKQAKGMEQFYDYWRLWGRHGAGDRKGIFDSRESIGIGHSKLWKYLMGQRRLWRKYLYRAYGFNVRTGHMASHRDCIGYPAIPVLEEPPAEGEQTSQDVFDRWGRRRQCLRHPFYQALEQYLAVCECLVECGDPPQLLANPRFSRYPERRLVLTVAGGEHVKSFLLKEMSTADYLPGETWGDYMERSHKHFRCRDMSSTFHGVYMPITKILDMDSCPDGDIDQFFGAFADIGISLTKDVKLKAALGLDGADPYESKRQLLPSVVMKQVVQKLLEIDDPLEREAAFRKLPGKAAYALGQVVGVKKPKPPPAVDLDARITSELGERVARERMSEATSQVLAQLSPNQRKVYVLHEADKLTLREIAQQLDIAPGTAASHLSRAKTKIKEAQKII